VKVSRVVPPEGGIREQLALLRSLAGRSADGIVDCSIGSPCDPVPTLVTAAVADAVAAAAPYPLSAGSQTYREAAMTWMARRFDVELPVAQIAACVGTKEFVASLPHLLRSLRVGGTERDTVLFPAVSYPTYAFGAHLAGCRGVPVALDADWNLDLSTVSDELAARALVLWLNVPGNPSGAVAGTAHFRSVAEWGRRHGAVVVSDEFYAEFAEDPHTILEAGSDGVLALHSLSKRSNFAGMRAGFYAGDPVLMTELAEIRRDLGLIVPTPVQAGAAAALHDDAHVVLQRERYLRRRALLVDQLAERGIVHDGGPMPMYLWLREAGERDPFDGSAWDLAVRFARAGIVVSPGVGFGEAGADHVRLALVQPDDKIRSIIDRLDAVAE
jgi:aspartate/methionine/tyrosine aminotransferase